MACIMDAAICTDLYMDRPAGSGRAEIYKEGVMLEVTQAATDQVAEYFQGKSPAPIRVFLNEGG